MKFAAITVSALAMAVAVADTSASTSYDEELGCWPISVEHDATYCIQGPICSGSGDSPAGSLCPVAGDVAIADCHSYLVSYSEDDSCALPVDTTCQVIKTGAWGCVISGSNSTGSGTGTSGDVGGDDDEDEGSSSGSVGDDISVSSIGVAASAGSISAGTIAAIAAVAGVVCVAVGAVIFKRRQQAAAPTTQETMVDVVTP